MVVKVGMNIACICAWFKLHEVGRNDVNIIKKFVDRVEVVIGSGVV